MGFLPYPPTEPLFPLLLRQLSLLASSHHPRLSWTPDEDGERSSNKKGRAEPKGSNRHLSVCITLSAAANNGVEAKNVERAILGFDSPGRRRLPFSFVSSVG
ncbi:hypothetical protein SAY87_013660 [Trapa incisa]|nr:hypothetical protein SAY87_013660 [Trapa incisa]